MFVFGPFVNVASMNVNAANFHEIGSSLQRLFQLNSSWKQSISNHVLLTWTNEDDKRSSDEHRWFNQVGRVVEGCVRQAEREYSQLSKPVEKLKLVELLRKAAGFHDVAVLFQLLASSDPLYVAAANNETKDVSWVLVDSTLRGQISAVFSDVQVQDMLRKVWHTGLVSEDRPIN